MPRTTLGSGRVCATCTPRRSKVKKGLIARAERAKAAGETGIALAAARGAEAQDRVARIERGEDVPGGLGKPMSAKDLLISPGMTAGDVRQCLRVDEIGEDGFDELLAEILKRNEAAERAAVRSILRRRRPIRAA
jgi:hypothetical protein